MKKIFLSAVLLASIVACAPFSQQIMQEVKKDIAFTEVAKAPETFRGEVILWGGVIIETLARSGDTLIFVRQTELDCQKRPKNPDQSAGRFILHYPGFLDPAIYSKGREITVVGKIAGKEDRLIGQRLYTYPVIENHALRLWEKWEARPYSYNPWYWNDPFFYPWPYYSRYRYYVPR